MKYKTQIKNRLRWIFNIKGMREWPRPCWFYPTSGWITDSKEIENAIRLDDELGIDDPKSRLK